LPVLRDADPLDRLNQPIEPTETKPKGKNLETNGKLILKGADGERGWIVLVHEETGKMSAWSRETARVSSSSARARCRRE